MTQHHFTTSDRKGKAPGPLPPHTSLECSSKKSTTKQTWHAETGNANKLKQPEAGPETGNMCAGAWLANPRKSHHHHEKLASSAPFNLSRLASSFFGEGIWKTRSDPTFHIPDPPADAKLYWG